MKANNRSWNDDRTKLFQGKNKLFKLIDLEVFKYRDHW